MIAECKPVSSFLLVSALLFAFTGAIASAPTVSAEESPVITTLRAVWPMSWILMQKTWEEISPTTRTNNGRSNVTTAGPRFRWYLTYCADAGVVRWCARTVHRDVRSFARRFTELRMVHGLEHLSLGICSTQTGITLGPTSAFTGITAQVNTLFAFSRMVTPGMSIQKPPTVRCEKIDSTVVGCGVVRLRTVRSTSTRTRRLDPPVRRAPDL